MFIDFPKINVPVQGLDEIRIPKLVKIHQTYDENKIDDIETHLINQLSTKIKDKSFYLNKNICITAGSRGIPNLDKIIRTICDTLKSWGAKPFIIPSMGSHGGATAEGQLEMLESYNITEESMQVPILSSMETLEYGKLNGIPLYCDKYAYNSDGIIILNKIKPHTDFRAEHESGLAKMMAIGIAKHKGATTFHSFGFHRFGELIPPVSEIFLEKCPVAFGVGVVQNAYDEICDVEVCEKEHIMETDARLLKVAKDKIAKFLFDDIDVLIIDEIGKNISGNGHDPNVTGRNITRTFGDSTLRLKKLFVRSLTPEAHHNGCGLGACDVTTRKCLNSVDWEVTWTNVLTTGIMDACMIPLYTNTDKEAIKLCIKTLYNKSWNEARVVHIKNTLMLNDIEVSDVLYEDIKNLRGISLIDKASEMIFDSDDMLISNL